MRTDVAFVLQSMGFVVDRDFKAVQDTPTNVNVIWKSQTTMPTVAAIDAAALTAVANIATAAAQAQKAAATTSIDNGQLITGAQFERLVRALALVVLDEINLIRANFAAPMTPRTAAQLVNAVKAKIALTAE